LTEQGNDTTELDDFAKAAFEAEGMSEPEQVTPEPSQAPEPNAEPARDENGRFTAKDEVTSDEQAQPDPAPQEPDGEPNTGHIPPAVLLAERQKAKDYKAQLDTLTQQNQQLQAQMQAFMSAQQRPQQPAQAEAKPESLWDDPETYIRGTIGTIEQRLQAQAEATSKMFAVQQFGEEAVTSAYQAMAQAVNVDPNAKHELARIQASQHPFGELVQWHKRNETLRRIGDDPQAYEAQLKQQWMNDPEVVKAVLANAQATAAANVNSQRSAPVTHVPPTLSRASAAGANAPVEADISSEGLFQHAMAR